MKNIRQLLAATILTIALAATTLAGDMHTPANTATPPPPPPPNPLRVADLPDETVAAGDALTQPALLFCYQMLLLF